MKCPRKYFLLFALLAVTATAGERPSDEAALDNILVRFRAILSAPAGATRDWAAFRDLFWPDARIIFNEQQPDGSIRPYILALDSYISGFERRVATTGFFERGLGREMLIYGQSAQISSAYETRRGSMDAPPTARGLNNIQLTFDGTRWRILSLVVQRESARHPLPDRYLAALPRIPGTP